MKDIYSFNSLMLRRNKMLLLLQCFLLVSFCVNAEGTKQLSPTAADRVNLNLCNPSYNSFGRYDGGTDQRLSFHIENTATEQVFLGFSQPRSNTSYPCTAGDVTAYFRIKDATGTVVFPTQGNPNGQAITPLISGWADAVAGPNQIVGSGGYNAIVFNPAGLQAGDYYVEFSTSQSAHSATPFAIEWWDITVATKVASPTAINGRVFAKNWAFYVPSPDCAINAFGCSAPNQFGAYNAIFKGSFHVYTTEDSIVTKVNFSNSGFQPLAFNIFFNDSGPGSTGNIIEDRKSINNALVSKPKYSLFLNDPDHAVYVSGSIGTYYSDPFVVSCDNTTGQFYVTVTRPGQVEVLVDLNTNSGAFKYDATSEDVLLALKVTPQPGELPPYRRKLNWDGKNGLGAPVDLSQPFNFSVNYTQGTFHLPVYDAEFMTTGFAFETVRPTPPPAANPIKIYFDDSNIPDDNLNGAAHVSLNGSVAPSHTWNSGCYGDANTINTWFFGSEERRNQNKRAYCLVDGLKDTATVTSSSIILSVLDNDGGVALDSSSLTTTGVIQPLHGAISLNSTNYTITYTPTSGYVGRDSFQYIICDSARYSCDTTWAVLTMPPCSTPSVGGTANYTGGTLCSTANMGVITLTGQTGDVIRWETSTNNGTSWISIAGTANKTSYTFINAANNQKYRVVVNSGSSGCTDAISTVVTITTSAASCTTATCTYSSSTFSPTISITPTPNFVTQLILIDPTTGLIQYLTMADSTTFTNVLPGDYIMYAVSFDTTAVSKPSLTVGANISSLTGDFTVSNLVITKVCCPIIPSVAASVTAQPNCSTATGTITITAPIGTGMTYSINSATYTNTTGVFTGVSAGTYIVTAKNNIGCLTTDTSVIVAAQPPTPSVPTLSIQQTTCATATGSITVTAPTGAGLTYSIDGSDYTNTTGIFSNLASAAYSVTAKNSFGCISTAVPVTINPQPETPTLLVVSKTAPLIGSCPITNTGTLTVVGNGSNLQYSIDAGANWQSFGTFTALDGGTHTVRIGNSVSGCYITTDVVVPTVICVEICTDGIDNDGNGDIDCNDAACMNATIATIAADKSVVCSTGSTATLTAGGGNTYLWSTGATTATISTTTPGTYSVTATRGTGCTDTASIVISAPSVSGFCNKTEITSGVNGVLITATNGINYLWSTPQGAATVPSVLGSTVGTYSVTITGTDGCTQTGSWTLTEKPVLTVLCDEIPNYRLALGKSVWTNETYSWETLDGAPITSHSALDTSIILNLSNARLDSVYRFMQIATRYGLQDTDVITLKILDCNIKPIIAVVPQTVLEDSTIQICLTYTDPNIGQTQAAVTNCTPQHGTATAPSVSAGQICFNYTPTANYNGQDTICLILCDNDLNVPKCDTVKVPITVTPVNDKPIVSITTPLPVRSDSTTTVCGTVTDVDILDTHTTTITCGPSHGTAMPKKPIDESLVCFTYTPNLTFSGTDTVCITVCDHGSPILCDTVIVVLEATANPLAINDFNTTLRNTPVTGGVATNDITNGFVCTYTPIITSPNGVLTMNPNGTYTFTPATDFVGQIDYMYKMCNAANVCDSAKLSITVYAPTPNNDAPIANDDVIQTNKNIPVTGYVTSNDFDSDGDPLRVNPSPVSGPSHGTLVLNPNGSYTYTPALNFLGRDSFEYVVCDLLNICDVAKVIIYVSEDNNGVLVNDQPNAQDDLAATPMNVPVSGSVRLNDSDPNAPNTTLVYTTTPLSMPTHGTVILLPNGNYTYTPTAGFYGNDEFKYLVCDAQGLCDSATVVVKVIPAVPDALNDINIAVKNAPVSGNLTTNDSGNGLPYTLNTTPVQQPAHGTIVVLPNGNYTYTPTLGFVGNDEVKYAICNASGVCDTAILTITVQDNPIFGINNPPIAKNDVIETFKNQQVAGSLVGNDFDIDGDPMTVTLAPVTTPSHGTLTLNVNGTYTYLPDPDYTGRDSFQYQICDNHGACTTAWAYADIKNDINGTANDKPNAEDDAITTKMGITVSGTMKPNDSDPNNNILTYPTTPVATTAHGSLTVRADGTFTYIPNASYSGTDQFKYAVCDNGSPSLCDTATVYIVIPNHRPSIVDSLNVTTFKDSAVTICTTITEVDSTDTLVTAITCAPQHGTVVPSVSGKQLCMTYTPTAGFFGTDSVCVAVCDAAGLCDTVKIKFTVQQICLNISLKVFLEGPFNTSTSLMSTTLNQRGLLPGQTPIGAFAVPTPAGQPYSTAPWNYFGNETVTTYAADVVDWVLVSFRTSPVLGATVFRAAGLLHNNGTITFPNTCIELPTGSFYVVIEHRNHLGIMSPSAVVVANNTMAFDFTTGQSYILTNPPSFGQKTKSSSWMMYAGDGKKTTSTMNYDINFSDSQLWKLESGIFDQYRYGDFNMDADVNFGDSQLWKLNNGRYSGVPH